jgi:hypothetical protein
MKKCFEVTLWERSKGLGKYADILRGEREFEETSLGSPSREVIDQSNRSDEPPVSVRQQPSLLAPLKRYELATFVSRKRSLLRDEG